MNKKQLSHLEKRLMEERARVMKELGYYDESFNATLQSSDGDLSSYSFHMADQGTDAMEREKQFLFASQEGRYLWHVNEALRRLYGTPDKFGHCHQCAGDQFRAARRAAACAALHYLQGERGRCADLAALRAGSFAQLRAGAAGRLSPPAVRGGGAGDGGARPGHQADCRGHAPAHAGHSGPRRLVSAATGLQSGGGLWPSRGPLFPLDLLRRRPGGRVRSGPDVTQQSCCRPLSSARSRVGRRWCRGKPDRQDPKRARRGGLPRRRYRCPTGGRPSTWQTSRSVAVPSRSPSRCGGRTPVGQRRSQLPAA